MYLKKCIPKPMFDDLGLKLSSSGNIGNLLIRRRLVNVEILPQDLELVLSDSCSSSSNISRSSSHRVIASDSFVLC